MAGSREDRELRLVCYLGTRGCPGVLEEALRDHFGPLQILVPTEPRLLGDTVDREETRTGLQSVGRILCDHARSQAIEIAQRAEDELAGVFGETTDPKRRISAEVLAGPMEQALEQAALDAEADRCFLARDALDILAEVGVDPLARLQPHGVELETR